MSLDTGEVQYRTCSVCNGTGSVAAEKSHFTTYPDLSLQKALQLMQRHGKPAEICIAGNHDIRVLFEDGSRYILGGFTVGYRGTGPDYTERFLCAAGFDISIDEIAEMEPPVTLVAGQPYIAPESLIFHAPTVEEARRKAILSVPPDSKIISLEVVCNGTTLKSVEGDELSEDAAFEDGKSKLPDHWRAAAEKEKILQAGSQGKLTVKAFIENEARWNASTKLMHAAVITSVSCTRQPRSGFLGRPGTYEVTWRKPWMVQLKVRKKKVTLTYRPKASVKVRFQPSSKSR
jgi:hypothetical protein